MGGFDILDCNSNCITAVGTGTVGTYITAVNCRPVSTILNGLQLYSFIYSLSYYNVTWPAVSW